MSVVGFDFGTTNSLISIIRGNGAISFLDREGLPTPSVVCFEGARKIVGRAAKERLSESGLGVHGNVIRSPKMLLGRESIFVEGVERSPVDIVADVVRYVAEQTVAGERGRGLESIQRAVVTIPINMDGLRRAALRDAFRKAGISIVQFIHEPLAALYGFFRSDEDYNQIVRKYDRQLMLVFDWGGGTLDLTLCRLIDGMLVQVKNDGDNDVGGDVFDETIKNEVVRRVQKVRGHDETVKVQPDAMMRLLHRCERAKIDLSTRNSVELYVGGFFCGVLHEELDYSLRREDLEEMIEPLLDKGLTRIKKILKEADVSPSQVALCLATGGMANMPAIKTRLHEWFGPQRVHVSERSATLVAEGAAWVAHDQAKLHLAKNIELQLARQASMTLIKAGTEMPQGGQVRSPQKPFGLYCADPRDGFAKFQLQSPVRPGLNVLPNDRRDPHEILVVKVDPQAKPFRERLVLDIQIDENLILRADVRSLEMKDKATADVYNLEFGLSLPNFTSILSEDKEPFEITDQSAGQHVRGDLVARSNIANRCDDMLVPGELLFTYNPQYFDSRLSPAKVQIDEKTYYEPCSKCNRASSDPLCKC